MIVVAPLRPDDRRAWEDLARGYKAFYGTPTSDEQYELSWRQLRDGGSGFHALGAYLDGTLDPGTAGPLESNSRARLLYDKIAAFNGFIRYDYPLSP